MASSKLHVLQPQERDRVLAEITSCLFSGTLELRATHAGHVESDAAYTMLQSRLRYVDLTAGQASPEVRLGTLTLPQQQLEHTDTMILKTTAIGEVTSRQEHHCLLAAEAAMLSDQRILLLVYYTREIQWGLTEYVAVPIILSEGRLIPGEQMQLGRDSISAPRYWGTIHFEKDFKRLVVVRNGDGGFSRATVLIDDGSGAFCAKSEDSAES